MAYGYASDIVSPNMNASAGQTKEPSQVSGNLSRCQANGKELDELLSMLAQRLGAVLGPDRPALAHPVEKPLSCSAHATALHDHAYVLASMCEHVKDLLARLEL